MDRPANSEHCAYLLRDEGVLDGEDGAWLRKDSLNWEPENARDELIVVATLPFHGPEGTRRFTEGRADAYLVALTLMPQHFGDREPVPNPFEENEAQQTEA